MINSTKWLVKQAPLLMAAVDEKLQCRCISDTWRDTFNVPGGCDVEIPLQDFLSTIDSNSLETMIAQILIDGESIHGLPVQLGNSEEHNHGLLSAWRVQAADDEQPWVLLAATDTTDHKKALEDLLRLQTTHQLILDAAGEGVYGIDCDGNTTFVNAAATEILGWKEEEILGKPLHDIHHHTHADGRHYPRDDCPIYAAIKDREVHRVDDEVFWHNNGTAVPVEYVSTPIICSSNNLQGAVVIFRDISERKRIEAEREMAYQQVKCLKDELEQERNYLRDEINITVNFGDIIGESQALKRTLAQIEAVADTPASVLILGESGVGKEAIARAIHTHSSRADKALVKVNCASIPKDLFESEFFGHVRGSFTGAHRDRVGRLQLANGGTLFLDEVGEIPLDLQGKLLRALQEHEFERVGDEKTVKVDVRVVAATNRDLQAEIKAGRFREDLYYRLSVFPIEVPPLRERKNDIGPLAMHFLNAYSKELGRDTPCLSKQQITTLAAHDWPGNIRELKNVIERTAILSSGCRLRLDLVMPGSAPPVQAPPSGDDSTPTELLTDADIRAIEKANLVAVLNHTGWRISGIDGAAEFLGLKPSTLTYRMKGFEIERES